VQELEAADDYLCSLVPSTCRWHSN